MTVLFEYGKWEIVANEEELKNFLLEVWANRMLSTVEEELSEENKYRDYQPFLNFDGDQIRAKNYVGFIQHGKETIEIYPKVFKNAADAENKKGLMLRHIFYWFDYCRKWRFPFSPAFLDRTEIDEFPELIIYLMASQILDTISAQPLSMFQQESAAMQMPKGAINFKRYINKSVARGRHHYLECDYEPFVYDNKINRIIKYCVRLLLSKTNFYESKRKLENIIFILDEVSDVPCSAKEIDRISVNPFFDDYLLLMEYCKLILNQQLYFNENYHSLQWCLLFPMEYIFEDFVAGFLQKWFSKKWHVHYQKSELYLARDMGGKKVFNMQHDIFLKEKNSGRKIIVDTKYKLRNKNFKNDPKKSISQNDLYQMTSYAFRRGCREVLLIYPNISENIHEPDFFEIKSGFSGQEKIKITAVEIPFWSFEDFAGLDEKLQVVFDHILEM